MANNTEGSRLQPLVSVINASPNISPSNLSCEGNSYCNGIEVKEETTLCHLSYLLPGGDTYTVVAKVPKVCEKWIGKPGATLSCLLPHKTGSEISKGREPSVSPLLMFLPLTMPSSPKEILSNEMSASNAQLWETEEDSYSIYTEISNQDDLPGIRKMDYSLGDKSTQINTDANTPNMAMHSDFKSGNVVDKYKFTEYHEEDVSEMNSGCNFYTTSIRKYTTELEKALVETGTASEKPPPCVYPIVRILEHGRKKKKPVASRTFERDISNIIPSGHSSSDDDELFPYECVNIINPHMEEKPSEVTIFRNTSDADEDGYETFGNSTVSTRHRIRRGSRPIRRLYREKLV